MIGKWREWCDGLLEWCEDCDGAWREVLGLRMCPECDRELCRNCAERHDCCRDEEVTE